MLRETQLLRKAAVTLSGTGSLPAGVVDLALKRIVILCLIGAGMALLGIFICLGTILMDGQHLPGGNNALSTSTDSLMVFVSLGLAWLVHRRVFAPRTLIALGLGYGVYVAAWQCVGECNTLATASFTPVAYFSFNQAWVVFFPAIIPVRSRATVLTILITAALPPLSRWATQTLGYVTLPDDSQVILSLLMMFSAIMALAVSHVVYRLGRSVKAAQELGSYTLEEHLGGGGMGEVWRASHRMLARPAAVKLIKPELLAGLQALEVERMNQRFEQEVQAAATLNSPHTVDIYDYGLSQDGVFYYVMELLDGIDLGAFVRRFGPMEPARVVHCLLQACHSLNEAHRHGLIHRDIKPANLLLCRYGEDLDFVKVLDFGLVKQSRAVGSNDPTLTVDGQLAGTPAFMYPEAVEGQGAVGPRSDLYSLGCVAYWLLTAELVFDAPSPMALLVEHARSAPVPPSQRSELDIPPALDALVMACLAKRPADRPRDADDLAARLRAVPLAAPWSPEQARAWWDLHLPARDRDLSPAGAAGHVR
ncbi:MAG: serine/threonine-protein kinase [Candidatus Krumholzibacteriia bacterium]